MREDSVERLLGGAEGDKSTQKFTQNKNERTKVRSKNRRKKECDLTYYSILWWYQVKIIPRIRDHYVYIFYPNDVNTYPLAGFFYYFAVLYISNLGSSE